MMVAGKSPDAVKHKCMASVMMAITASPGGKPGWLDHS